MKLQRSGNSVWTIRNIWHPSDRSRTFMIGEVSLFFPKEAQAHARVPPSVLGCASKQDQQPPQQQWATTSCKHPTQHTLYTPCTLYTLHTLYTLYPPCTLYTPYTPHTPHTPSHTTHPTHPLPHTDHTQNRSGCKMGIIALNTSLKVRLDSADPGSPNSMDQLR